MFDFLKSRSTDEDGAVTVDWVVLTATMIGLAAGGATATLTGVEGLGGKVESSLATRPVE